MSYEFRCGEGFGRNLKRVARQQVQRLTGQLGDAVDASVGHHEARKCIKRLRALLVLARPAIGNKDWSRLDRHLGKAGRALAGARDAAVLLALLSKLESEHGPALLGAAGRRLRDELKSQTETDQTTADQPDIAERLAGIEAQLSDLPFGDLEWTDAFTGLEADYRSGRQALELAEQTGHPEDFHELRKHVQRHWRHMQLFKPAWPAESAARIELGKTLSEVLGEQHDFWLLAERLATTEGRLARLCQDKIEASRDLSRSRSRLLYADRPTALHERMATYWRIASKTGG